MICERLLRMRKMSHVRLQENKNYTGRLRRGRQESATDHKNSQITGLSQTQKSKQMFSYFVDLRLYKDTYTHIYVNILHTYLYNVKAKGYWQKGDWSKVGKAERGRRGRWTTGCGGQRRSKYPVLKNTVFIKPTSAYNTHQLEKSLDRAFEN